VTSRATLVVLHLPGLTALLITVMFSAEWEVFRPLKTEQTFGWWVLVLVPAAVILGLVQVGIWVTLLARRAPR
jgi:hypothetical protein